MLASFPGSSAPEREIELIRAESTRVYISCSGEPGNEASNMLHTCH